AGQEAVAQLYREVLADCSDRKIADAVGQRAMAWHEEWLGEDSEGMFDVLHRVLDVDPRSDWAFQRLTVLYTATGQWNELLSVYDGAIAEAKGRDKITLLDEAANIAKDFAGDADRAIS